MSALVDANVWLPILVERHEHHGRARSWWDSVGPGEACWCRPIQQTILRLLCNRTIMEADVLMPEHAWRTWDQLVMDERTAFLPLEPADLDSQWRRNFRGRGVSTGLWMDSFLAAWAESDELAFVTFDSGFRNYQLSRLELLSP